jgi:hypothetical protein
VGRASILSLTSDQVLIIFSDERHGRSWLNEGFACIRTSKALNPLSRENHRESEAVIGSAEVQGVVSLLLRKRSWRNNRTLKSVPTFHPRG